MDSHPFPSEKRTRKKQSEERKKESIFGRRTYRCIPSAWCLPPSRVGLAFLYFAASTISGDDDEEEEEGGKSKIRFAPLAVFCTFFVAELGDKTQLTAITFGANEGMGSAFVVWIGCSLGLFAADILGMLVGYLLKSKTPDGLLNTLAFVIFSIFGVYTLYQGLKLISASVCPLPVWPVLIAATAVFVAVCVCLFVKREKKKAK